MPKALRVLLHSVIFSAAGGLANLLAIRFLIPVGNLRQVSIGPLSYPYTLLLGFGVGALCWFGFELGRVRWRRFSLRRGQADDNLLMPVLSVGLVLCFVLGFGLAGAYVALGNGHTRAGTAVLIGGCALLLATFPVTMGVVAGARREPSAFLSGFFPLLLGAFGGGLFGVGTAIVWAVFYTPPPCTGRCFQLPAIFVAYILVFFCTAAGAAMGYLSGASAGIGVLLSRLVDPALRREWRLPEEIQAAAPDAVSDSVNTTAMTPHDEGGGRDV